MPGKKQIKKTSAKKEIKKELKKVQPKVVAKSAKVVAKKPVVKKTENTYLDKIKSVSRTIGSSLKEKEKTNFGVMNVLAIIVLFVIIGVVAWVINKTDSTHGSVQKNPTTNQGVSYDCNSGQTALDALKIKNTLQTQNSSQGVFVSSINGIQNSDNSLWIYYINGQLSNVSPDQYKCQDGDKIDWVLTKIS
jgi:hypothetical protein